MQRVVVTSTLLRRLHHTTTTTATLVWCLHAHACCHVRSNSRRVTPDECITAVTNVNDDNGDDKASLQRLCALLRERRNTLHTLVRRTQHCEDAARRFAHVCLLALCAYLCTQTAVLWYWTYVVFDWNTVEPLTYLLGYSLTWASIAWYSAHRCDLDCEGVRDVLERHRYARLCRAAGVDTARIAPLRHEVQRLEQHVRATRELLANEHNGSEDRAL